MCGSSAFVLVEREEITVIDAGWKGKGRRVLATLESLGRSPQEISYIIATHYHLDHIGGVAQVKDPSPGRTAIHESEVRYVERKDGEKLPNPFQNRLLGFLMSPLLALYHPPPFSVDLPLQDGAQFPQLGGMEVVHTPGHTPGSISLHFPQEGLLIVGDALQYKNGKFGLPHRLFSSDLKQAQASVRRLAQLDFDTLCFSHFPALQKGAAPALRAFADTLE
jgi:glyoxylase-like metal-dependent hydrolase (beta-lactamase superfamily II)